MAGCPDELGLFGTGAAPLAATGLVGEVPIAGAREAVVGGKAADVCVGVGGLGESVAVVLASPAELFGVLGGNWGPLLGDSQGFNGRALPDPVGLLLGVVGFDGRVAVAGVGRA